MSTSSSLVVDSGRGPRYKIVNGYKFPHDFKVVEDALKYEAKPDDLFIVTFPKCGTTWTQQIVGLILHNGDLPDGKVFKACPFLEYVGRGVVEKMKQPFAIKTHLHYDIQPKHPTAKYIFVLRNPKDTAVSFYYHQVLFPDYIGEGVTFSEYLPYFLRGEQQYGDYYDWVLSWWPHRNDPNVLFLLYEDMKSDIKSNVLKIASFIGKEYKDKLLVNDGQILTKVIERSSLQSMQKGVNEEIKRTFIESGGNAVKEEYNFVRKGIVGDWKNHFTVSENELFEKHFHERVDGTGIEFLWDQYDVFSKQ